MVENYVDGFVLPIPKKNMPAYKKMATTCSKVWLKCGAINYFECIEDDVKKGKVTSFPKSVKLKRNEILVFSYITYKSRKHRDQVIKKVFQDPAVQKIMTETANVFNPERMIYGGFKMFINRNKKR